MKPTDPDPSGPASEAGAPSSRLALRLWRGYVARHKTRLALILALMVVVASGVFAYAALTQMAIDWLGGVKPGDPQSRLPGWLQLTWLGGSFVVAVPVLIISATFIRAAAQYVQTLLSNAVATQVVKDLQDDQFAALTEADMAQLSSVQSGTLVSRFTNDTRLIGEALIRASNNLVRDVLTIVGGLAWMFWADWALALISIAVYPLAIYPVVRVGQRIRKSSEGVQVHVGDITALVGESFAGARMVKTYGLEAMERARAGSAFERYRELMLRLAGKRALVDPLMEAAAGIALGAVFAFAGWRVMSGAATAGSLVGFVAALGMMAGSARALGTLNAVLQEAFAALQRVFAILDRERVVTDRPGAAPLRAPVRGEVTFEAVSFRYPGMDSAALDDVSFEVRAGETVALVGPSGAGKSTVFNLVPRLFDPSAGQVLIDGQPIAEVGVASVRGAVALVSQEAALFHMSVADNIRLGRPQASDAEVRRAAADADAMEFIETLPEGFNSLVGERGSRLSGGQRQRVALARAFLRDAPILLLDEATAALDTETEARIQAALERLSEGRTTLVIAHRLATVRGADRILVFDQGRIVEEGTHDQLLARAGLYARLAAQQFQDA